MKKVVGLVLLGVAFVGIRKGVSAILQGNLLEKMESAMESCPPIKAMRKLEDQNTEMIGLLRDQNAMLWRRNSVDAPASEAV